MEPWNSPLDSGEIGMRLVSSEHSDEKGRHQTWLCLGDVQPHFETLKGVCDSLTSNHVVTDDSDDFTSEDEDCTLEAKNHEYIDSPIHSPQEALYTFKKQEPQTAIDKLSQLSSDWPVGVTTILAQHLVDYHRFSNANDASHVAIKISEEASTLMIPTCTYNSFTTSQNSASVQHQPEDNNNEPQVTHFSDNRLLSSKKRRIHQESHPKTRIDCFPAETKRRSVVTLHTRVSVIPIPARDEYSPRARESMWSSFTEMARNIARNSIEFASEGWNWRNVMEDDDMLVHDVSGELIHPIHIRNALAFIGDNEDLFVTNHFSLDEEAVVNNVSLVLPTNID